MPIVEKRMCIYWALRDHANAVHVGRATLSETMPVDTRSLCHV
jgi:hypothetical protein